MRRRPGTALMIVLALGLLLGAAGCGKKKSSSTSTSTAAATTTTTTSTTTTTTTESTSTAGSETTTSSSSTNALGALGTSKNCQSLLQLGQAFSSAMTGANGDVKKEADLLKQFADKTPSDIRPDFETLADAMEKIADAMKGVKVGGTPDPASLAKLTQLATQLDSPKLTAAEQHIQTWAQNNCHS